MTSETIDKLRKSWDGTAVIGYAIIALAFAVACGYSISSWQNQTAMAAMAETARIERQELTDRFSAERDELVKANKKQLDYVRKQLRERNSTVAKQSDQLAKLGEKGVDAAKKSSELGQQILEGSVK